MKRLISLLLLGAAGLLAQVTPTVTIYNNTTLTTAVTVKSSQGNVAGWVIYNPNSSICYLQIFNAASVTLGTTTEIINVPVQPSSPLYQNTYMIPFTSAITVAATTAAHGSSTCGTGMVVELFYQ